MKVDAKFHLRPEQGYNPKRCVLNLIRNLPNQPFNSLDIVMQFAAGSQSFSRHFSGTEFTLELNEVPTVVTLRVNKRVENRLEGKAILKLSTKTQLRILIDSLLAEHPRGLQSKYERI